MPRTYRTATFRDATIRFSSSRGDVIEREFVRLRETLERYILRHPDFLTSLVPVVLLPDAPPIAVRMHRASLLTGVGPMAAVAGAVAEGCAAAALSAGADEALVENGGDMYLHSGREITVGIFTGTSLLSGKIAFRLTPESLPLSVCSSSSVMGHSLSFGACDLAVVTSKDAALADAAATLACNLVKAPEDIDPALRKVSEIPGILGVLIVKGDAVGKAGELPPLVRVDPSDTAGKVTRY